LSKILSELRNGYYTQQARHSLPTIAAVDVLTRTADALCQVPRANSNPV
jgi:hypothetical protein